MNDLKHMAEFHSVLKDYKPSDAAKRVLSEMKLVLLTAPTAGGRNTIIDRLVQTGDYQFIVSDTTRQPRVNKGIPEQNGREYWFRKEDEVLADLKSGLYLEAELIHNQQVSGISIRVLEEAKAHDKIAINEVDMQGISNVLPVKPDTIGILILPPSFAVWQHRVDSRGEISVEERKRRYASALEIFAMARDGKYPVVINDDLDDAVHKVDKLARTGAVLEDQELAHQVAAQLYLDTQNYLKQLA